MIDRRRFAVGAAIELEPVGVFEDLLADHGLRRRIGVQRGDHRWRVPFQQYPADIEDHVTDIHARSMADEMGTLPISWQKGPDLALTCGRAAASSRRKSARHRRRAPATPARANP